MHVLCTLVGCVLATLLAVAVGSFAAWGALCGLAWLTAYARRRSRRRQARRMIRRYLDTWPAMGAYFVNADGEALNGRHAAAMAAPNRIVGTVIELHDDGAVSVLVAGGK